MPPVGDPIQVSAQILRIEALPKETDSEKTVMMAFVYKEMDDVSKKSLLQYLQINDPDPDPTTVT